MKKLLLLLLFTSTLLFAQDKSMSTYIFWKPLLYSSDDEWGYGNKVGLGIERKLNKKFDLAFNINNGYFTKSSIYVINENYILPSIIKENYIKSTIINIDLNARFMFSRNRIINVFAEVSGSYTTIHSYEISYVLNEFENKTFESTRNSYISPCAKVGLRLGRGSGRFSTELSILEYNPFEKGIIKGNGILKLMLKLK